MISTSHVHQRLARGLLLAMLPASQTVAETCSAQAPTYRVEPLTFDARVADTVGPKRSGSLCFPAGSIAWREARPEVGDAKDAFAAGLRAGGLATVDMGNPFGDSARSADRAIRASVRGVRLSACVPPGGWGRVLTHSQAVKGDGVIAITWRAYARGQDAPVTAGPTCVTFIYNEPRATLALMTLAGLQAAGRQVATDVLAGGKLKATEEENCRRLSERPGSTFIVTTGED